MPDAPEAYTPPKVWKWDRPSGGRFADINRPIAGATHDKELPVGAHPMQLYSLATPNGVKVTVMLEELLALGHSGAEYDAWLVNIMGGDQFGSGFVGVNPNSKIPAMVDRSTSPPTRLFESGAILFYLAEKFGELLPTEGAARAECMNWLFWQMGSAPFLGGGFGHFYAYAPEKIEYAIDRFAMEVKRQLDVLDRNLADRRFLAGDRLHDRGHRDVAMVRRAGEGASLRGRRVPRRCVVRERRSLDRRDRGAASRSPRAARQPRLGPRGRASSRTTLGRRRRRRPSLILPLRGQKDAFASIRGSLRSREPARRHESPRCRRRAAGSRRSISARRSRNAAACESRELLALRRHGCPRTSCG